MNFGESERQGMAPSIISQRRQGRAILAAGVFVVLISLFFGLSSLWHFREAQVAWEHHNTRASAVVNALADFNRQTGYGGFIHNFKNLVLSRDLTRYQPNIEANIAALRVQLDQLDTLLEESEDKAAIAQIRSTFEEHISNYAKVHPMVAAGASSEELDAVVKVNDGPALKALAELNTRFIVRATEVRQRAQQTYAEGMRFAWVGGGLVMAAIIAAVVAMMLFLRRSVAANAILLQTQAHLTEREQQLRETQRIAQLGGWKAHLASGRLLLTEETCHIFGLPVTEPVTIAQALSHCLPESRQRFEQAVNTAVEDRKPFDLELQISTAQGDVRWVRVQGEVRHEVAGPSAVAGTVQDITEQKQAESALREAHDIFDRSLAVAFLWRNEENWPVEFVSTNVTALFGYTADEFTSGAVVYSSLIHPEDLTRVGEEVVRHSSEKDTTKFTHLPYRIITKGGQVKWVNDDTAIRRKADGSVTHYQGVLIDITERIVAQEQLRLTASVFSHAREGITITDHKGTMLDVNDAFTRITGYTREEAIGQNPSILSSDRQNAAFYQAMWGALQAQGHWSGEIWNRRKDGTLIAELLTISAIRDGQGSTQQYVGLFSDITERKTYQSQLEHLAHFDALTHLPNRTLLADRLHQAMAQEQRRGRQLAVVFLDLDGFKAINDQHGHQTGDQMLIALSTRLKEALREGDTLARIGGDEFVAVLTDLEDTATSVPLLKRLLTAASLPVPMGDLSLQLSASLGVTFYPQAQDLDADRLLRQADQAMYQAKGAGKNRYCVFDATQG
ncbi:diguanylate cyclase [Rhodoferax sp.]|uniref:diguanylate cyclase domain-containing protein n=1 Tax=Rhodoferax sp. TaxID=50421 RepID=UPI001A068EA5|nr:sensor domain-containing diguanylate cyclase [Rhodoferax sp.]MBE0472887.1 diguanylate cyclase [Rhodoferax sp.]